MTPHPFTRAAEALGLATRSAPAPEAPAPASPAVMPPARAAAASVPVSEALTLDAVFRAFFVLQTATEQLSLDVWRGPDKLEGLDVPQLVRRPDPDTHLADFLAEVVTSLAGQGNAYLRVHRWNDGQPIALKVLNPLEVTPWRTRAGVRMFTHHGKDYPARDISHLRLLKLAGTELGLGPVQAAQRGLRGQLTQVAYADGWFDAGHVPSGVLTTDQPLTNAEAAAAKEHWQATQSYTNGPAVLGRGLSYRPLMLKPAEVQWLETQRFGVTSVARWFGMPSRYLLAAIDGTSDTYANQEQEDIAFVRYTLMRYLREIETAFDQLLPRTTTVRMNVDALLRTDTKTRYQAHEIGIRAGFLLPAEVRAIEGLPLVDAAQLPSPAPALPAALEDQETTP